MLVNTTDEAPFHTFADVISGTHLVLFEDKKKNLLYIIFFVRFIHGHLAAASVFYALHPPHRRMNTNMWSREVE